MTRPIILNCHTGDDDAMAILLARGCPDVALRAITTVAGDQTLDKTTLNARSVCIVADIPDHNVDTTNHAPPRTPKSTPDPATSADVTSVYGVKGERCEQ